MRKKIITLFTFLGGIYFFLYFVIPAPILETLHVKQNHENISLGFVAIGLVTFGLGIINLFMIHGARLVYLKNGWPQSTALILGLLTMLVFAILDWRADQKVLSETANLSMLAEYSAAIAKDAAAQRVDVPPVEKRIAILEEEVRKDFSGSKLKLERNPYDESAPRKVYDEALAGLRAKYSEMPQSITLESLPQFSSYLSEVLSAERELLSKHAEETFAKKFFTLLFQGLFVSLGSALFSLLGVYIAAAAYRAFRIKTMEATLMMVAALIVMLGQIPFGVWIYEDMPLIRSWILEVPNSAASRAITIGAAVAGLVLAFRMWFSIESDSFSKDK